MTRFYIKLIHSWLKVEKYYSLKKKKNPVCKQRKLENHRLQNDFNRKRYSTMYRFPMKVHQNQYIFLFSNDFACTEFISCKNSFDLFCENAWSPNEPKFNANLKRGNTFQTYT